MKTTEQFIEDCKASHKPNEYDYSKTVYTGSKNRVIIKCNCCGREFEQQANSHKRGRGCPFCAGKIKVTKDMFLERAKKMYGDLYDYSYMIYESYSKEIKIKCKTCGRYFYRTPETFLNNHLDCPGAVKERKLQAKIERHKHSPNHRKYGYY